MTVGGSSIGALTVGFTSMIRAVLPGSSPDLNAKTSVSSSRVSSPGNLRLAALKWLDMPSPPCCPHRAARTRRAPSAPAWAGPPPARSYPGPRCLVAAAIRAARDGVLEPRHEATDGLSVAFFPGHRPRQLPRAGLIAPACPN